MDDMDKARAEYREKTLSEWAGFIEDVSGGERRKSWCDRDQIVDVLQRLAGSCSQNHMFFPVAGGLDITGARLSTFEDDCIEIMTGNVPNVVRPARMDLVRVGEDDDQSYLRIECLELDPLVDDKPGDKEEIARTPSGEVYSRFNWDEGVTGHFDDNGRSVPLPPGTELVVRQLTPGVFVIFHKASPYNHCSGTYQAPQDSMSADEFENYVKDMI